MQDVVLEPISTGDIIDRSVRLYRKNFGMLILIVAVPSILAYAGTLMSVYGYLTTVIGNNEPSILNIFLMLIGYFILYVIWPFMYLMMFGGMVRAVADHIMLGNAITLRGTVKLIKGRVGQLILAGLLLLVLSGVAFFALYIVLVVVAILLSVVFAALASAVPGWVLGTFVTLVIIAAAAGLFVLALAVIARLMFIPHAIMIEGLNAGSALSRSFNLGKGNWYKVLGITLFDYFVTFSTAMAFFVIVLLIAYLVGLFTITNENEWLKWIGIGWTFVAQLSSILTTPILAITSTLLYFDSRVRKEAYDIELIVRRITALTPVSPAAPVMPVQPAFVPAMVSTPTLSDPNWARTSPLGLSTYAPKPPTINISVPSGLSCPNCGQPLMAGAKFCVSCGVKLAS